LIVFQHASTKPTGAWDCLRGTAMTNRHKTPAAPPANPTKRANQVSFKILTLKL